MREIRATPLIITTDYYHYYYCNYFPKYYDQYKRVLDIVTRQIALACGVITDACLYDMYINMLKARKVLVIFFRASH